MMFPIVSADLTGPIDAERIPQTVCAMDSYRCVVFNKKLTFCWSLWAFFFCLTLYFLCVNQIQFCCVCLFLLRTFIWRIGRKMLFICTINLPLKHFNKHLTRWMEKDVLPLSDCLYKTNLWVIFVQNSIYPTNKNISKKSTHRFQTIISKCEFS